MEHEVTHSCGHGARHAIYGTFAADIDRQARQLARRKCASCYKAGKVTKAVADGALLDGIDLPALAGSAKQVSWAETIRVERLAVLHRVNPTAVSGFVGIGEAKWWIDNRTVDLRKVIPPT